MQAPQVVSIPDSGNKVITDVVVPVIPMLAGVADGTGRSGCMKRATTTVARTKTRSVVSDARNIHHFESMLSEQVQSHPDKEPV